MLVALAVTAVPLGMAAKPSLDSETTNTTTTTDVTNDSVLSDFDASASNHTYIEYTADSDNSAVKIKDPDTGTVYYKNTSVMTTDGTNGHYAVNISHDELADMPVEANKNTTATVVITNNTEASNPDTFSFNLTLAADGSRTVVDLNNDVASNEDSFSSKTLGLFGIESLAGLVGDHEVSSLDQNDLSVNGSNTTVTVYLSNQTAQDAFSAATKGTEAGVLDVDLSATMDTGSKEVVVPHFIDEAPDTDALDGTTYGVYHTDSNKIVYHLGDEFDGKSEIDSMSVKSGNALSWGSVLSFSRDYGFGVLSQKAIPGFGPLF